MQPTTHQKLCNRPPAPAGFAGKPQSRTPAPSAERLTTATADKPMSEDEIAAAEAADLRELYRGM